MKKIIKLLFLLLVHIAYSQVTDTGDKVGIGTTTPSEKLEIIGNLKAKQGRFINTLPNGYTFTNGWGTESALISAGIDKSGQGLFNFYDIPQSNLTSKPRVWFDIEDRDDNARLRFWADEGGAGKFSLYNKNQNTIFNIYDSGDDYTLIDFNKENSHVVIGGVNVWPVQHKLTVKNGSSLFEGDIFSHGNVGIGTTDTKGFKLGVQGKIAAEEVKVAIYNNWADFVFENNYKLPTLKEVEQHIKEKGHLKDIPSAEDVKQNGIFLGEMDSKLLQKIEELTLYTIEQQKEIENLKRENTKLQSLSKRLEDIEKVLSDKK